MQVFPLVDYKNHFIREDGVIISALNKERKPYLRIGGGHLVTCLSVENKKYVLEIYKLLVKAAYKEYDADIHDIYFVDGNKQNIHLSNVKIRSKIETFRLAEKGIVKKVVKGEHVGWDARTYDAETKKPKYIGTSSDLVNGERICKDKYIQYMTDKLIKKLFNEDKQAKIPKLFK
jgi:hypothetical protein